MTSQISIRRLGQIAVIALLATAFAGCATAQTKSAMTPKHVLVVSTTAGFRHSSIPTAEKVIGQLAQSSSAFTVEYARVEPSESKFKGADGASGIRPRSTKQSRQFWPRR